MSDVSELLNIDINELTIAEVVEIEERTGLPLDALGQSDRPKGKMLQALAYIVKRRDDPEFTWEQAGELRISAGASDTDPSDADGS